MKTVTVNLADWDGPEIPKGWAVANAPRPIPGKPAWTGPFRHGIFYAMAETIPGGTFGWEADDARIVVFITNAQVEKLVLAKFLEYGFHSEEEAGVTIAEQAACMQLPWHEEG